MNTDQLQEFAGQTAKSTNSAAGILAVAAILGANTAGPLFVAPANAAGAAVSYFAPTPIRPIRVDSPASDVEAQFNELAQQWYRETRMLSFINQKIMHPAHKRIVRLGREALPFILREVKNKRGDWFWTLGMLVDDDQNPPKGIPNYKQASEAWMEWASRNKIHIA
jgi:uncharacterized protein YukE